MCDRAERRLLAEEREEEHYQELYAKVEDEMKAAWERDFGPTFKAKYPYVPDGAVIHKEVTKRMRGRWND